MSAPPITDRLPVSLRAFAGPQFVDLPDPDKPAPRTKSQPLAASKWTLIFDCETTTQPGQALRFGTYQVRNGDALDEAGLFYEPDGVTANELATLRDQAAANGLELRTREQFVDEVFFARAYQLRAAIVGFNLPFDISRLAISHATTKTPVEGVADAMHGGFTFKLSRQKIYPNVRVKHLSQRAALKAFAATMGQRDSRGQRRRGIKTGIRRGHYIDLKTIAGALFARSFSLGSLSHFLGIENAKLDFEDFDGPITDDMARYAVRDVQATWECYRECVARFGRLGLSRTPVEKIYSEAGIGKGYLREMGIQPWRDLQPDFPRDMLGKIMGSYFGGRSEVRIITQQLGWLDYYWPAWVQREVLPLFDLKDARSEAAWHGRTYDRNGLSRKTWSKLAPILLEMLSGGADWELDESAQRSHIQLLVALTLKSGKAEPIISPSDARNVFMRLDDSGRANAISALSHLNANEGGWAKTVEPFISQSWPRQLKFRGEQSSRAFARLAQEAGRDFPEAVKTVLPFLRPVPHLETLAYNLLKDDADDDRDLARRFPSATLTFLDALIPDDRSSIPYNLQRILEVLAEADPTLRQSKAWRRLQDLTQ